MFEAVAQNVRRLREERGWSQEQLAAAARFDPTDVSKIENARAGERGWGLRRVYRLARALGVTPGELLTPAEPAPV